MTKNILLLRIHCFVSAFRLFFVFQPIYFAQITGSYTKATAVLAIATITSTIMDIPTGILSDKRGRKFTLVLASTSLAVGTIFYAMSLSAVGLFFGAAFYGLAMCLFNGNNSALLYETLKSGGKEGEFHHYQGRNNSMISLGLGVSALCASFLTEHGLRMLFTMSIVPQVLSIVVALFIDEPRVHTAVPEKNLHHLKEACIKIWRNPHLRGLTIAQAFTYGAEDAKYQFQSVYFNTLWPTWALGIYFTLNQALCFVSFWFAGRVVDRFRAMLLLVIQQAYWVVSQVFAIVLSNIATPLIFMTDNILYGPAMVARDHLLQKEFTDEQRATMGSVASFAASLVFSIAAFGIGIVSDRFGLAAGMFFGVMMSAAALPLYISLYRKGF